MGPLKQVDCTKKSIDDLQVQMNLVHACFNDVRWVYLVISISCVRCTYGAYRQIR